MERGDAYWSGQGVTKDLSFAFEMYKKAWEAGSAEALLKMARFYLNGFNRVKIDLPKALELVQEAVKRKVPGAVTLLARFYLAGYVVPEDKSKAVELAKIEADANPTATVLLASEAVLSPSSAGVRAAFDKLLLLAKAGDPNEQYTVGFCFNEGIGHGCDEKQAAQMFKLAAEQGHARAQLAYAWCLAEGKSAAADKAEMAEWIEKAALQGDREAQYRWAHRLLQDGNGLEAMMWMGKAATRGHTDAIKYLANQKHGKKRTRDQALEEDEKASSSAKRAQTEAGGSAMDAELNCAICLDWFKEPVSIPCCGNTFCRACLEKAVKESASCPLCRAKTTVNVSQLPRNVVLQRLLDKTDAENKSAAKAATGFIHVTTKVPFSRSGGTKLNPPKCSWSADRLAGMHLPIPCPFSSKR